MFLADPNVYSLPTALVVGRGHHHYETLRVNYPGWNGVHLTPLGFVVMTTEAGNPVNPTDPLYFWIPTREKGRADPGIDFWKSFWEQIAAEAAGHEAAYDDKRESHDLQSWVATLARGERDTETAEHHAFADLALVNEGIQICVKHCSVHDLRTLGTFLLGYAAGMEKGNTP